MIPLNAKERVQEALQQPNRSAALYDLACEMRDDGAQQQELYDFFCGFIKLGDDPDSEDEQDDIYGLLDSIAGTCTNSQYWIFGKKLSE